MQRIGGGFLGSESVPALMKPCFSDITVYQPSDACEDCSVNNECCAAIIDRYEAAVLVEHFGFTDEDIAALKVSSDAGEVDESDEASVVTKSLDQIVQAKKHQMMVDRRQADLTEEERAHTEFMPAEEFARFLGRRRVTNHRERHAGVAVPERLRTASINLRPEFEQRRDLLADWVERNKGPDKFARSLVRKNDRNAVLAIWIIRERISATPGARRSLEAMAERLQPYLGVKPSRQTIKRWVDKLNKLESAGRPWHSV